VGRAIRCPHCSKVQKVPDAAKAKARMAAKAAAAGDLGAKPIDFNLMTEAARKTVDITDADEHKDPDAIDWNAIAGTAPKSAASAGKPTQSRNKDEPAPSLASIIDMEADEEIAAREAPTGGRFDKFAVDAFAAIPFAGNYLIQILLVVILVFAMGLLMPILAMGVASLLESMPHREIAIGMAVLLLIPQLICLGYLSQVWLEIAHTTADEQQSFMVPDFSIGTALGALMMYALFFAVYIAPIITIPLAPMAFLVLSRTHDARAFDIGYVGRLTLQHMGYVAIVLAITVGAAVASYFVAAGLFPVIARFSLSMIEGLSIEACDFVAGQSTFFLVSPLLILTASGAARLSGLLGKHNPHIFAFMPAKRNFSASLGYSAAAIVAGLLIVPGLLLNTNIAANLGSRFVASNVIDLSEIRKTGPTQVVTDGPKPPTPPTGYVPPGPGPYGHIEVPIRDISKLSPDELLTYRVQQLRSADPVRQQESLLYLENATPNEKRDDVLTAIEQYIEHAQNPLLVTAAFKAHAAWNDEPLRGTIVRLKSRDKAQRLIGLKQLPEMEPSDDGWLRVSQPIDTILRQETDAQLVAAAVAALLVWHKDPMTRLSLELEQNWPSAPAVIAALGTPGHDAALPVLLRHVARPSPHRAAATQAIARIGKSAEDPVLEMLGPAYDPAARVAAATILQSIGSEKSLAALKAAAADPAAQLAEAARVAMRKIAPDQFSEMDEILLDIERNLTSRGGATPALIKLKAVTPSDEDRTKVIDTVAKLLTGAHANATATVIVDGPNGVGRTFRSAPFDAIEILAAWADDDAIARLVKLLEVQGERDFTLRRNLFLVFGKAKNAKSVVAVAKWLEGDQFEATNALVAIGRPAEDHMIRLLDTSGNDNLKMTVIRVMEKIGGPKSLARLVPMARSKNNTSLKYAAASAVLTIQSREKDK